MKNGIDISQYQTNVNYEQVINIYPAIYEQTHYDYEHICTNQYNYVNNLWT